MKRPRLRSGPFCVPRRCAGPQPTSERPWKALEGVAQRLGSGEWGRPYSSHARVAAGAPETRGPDAHTDGYGQPAARTDTLKCPDFPKPTTGNAPPAVGHLKPPNPQSTVGRPIFRHPPNHFPAARRPPPPAAARRRPPPARRRPPPAGRRPPATGLRPLANRPSATGHPATVRWPIRRPLVRRPPIRRPPMATGSPAIARQSYPLATARGHRTWPSTIRLSPPASRPSAVGHPATPAGHLSSAHPATGDLTADHLTICHPPGDPSATARCPSPADYRPRSPATPLPPASCPLVSHPATARRRSHRLLSAVGPLVGPSAVQRPLMAGSRPPLGCRPPAATGVPATGNRPAVARP
ncbi:hypothetical protein SAMN05444920_121199 [Nonomuraea solani]|uniref:Uncharacterized protein n=1 Tax=Nonomuraea solani TaxID=1144553 RepID=A0A1H6EXB3_9ACTN|nr:hypothetical protein SAMN05444920_121199 [Nonomuraea solani]